MSLSPLLVLSSPAKTAVPFSCPLPATCQGAASVFGTLQPRRRAEQPQGLHWGRVCAARGWLGKGADLQILGHRKEKQPLTMLRGTTLDSFFAVFPNR